MRNASKRSASVSITRQIQLTHLGFVHGTDSALLPLDHWLEACEKQLFIFPFAQSEQVVRANVKA